jgi:polyhydroxybutyrate depolymerase
MAQLHFGRLSRTYRLHVPDSLRPGEPAPLVLVLHGGGGAGATMARLTHMDRVADENGFIAAYPDGIMGRWADGRGTTPPDRMGVDDLGFLCALVDEVAHRHTVNPARVYATGISNGAFMAERLACDASERFAAVAAVAGPIPEALAARCRPSEPVSFLLIHGTDDPVAPYEGGMLHGPFGALALSAKATAETWARASGCSRKPKEETIAEAEDGTTARRRSYSGGRGGAEVVLVTVEGGGHAWPGGIQYLPIRMIGRTSKAFDASELIWEFFQAHPKA